MAILYIVIYYGIPVCCGKWTEDSFTAEGEVRRLDGLYVMDITSVFVHFCVEVESAFIHLCTLWTSDYLLSGIKV